MQAAAARIELKDMDGTECLDVLLKKERMKN